MKSLFKRVLKKMLNIGTVGLGGITKFNRFTYNRGNIKKYYKYFYFEFKDEFYNYVFRRADPELLVYNVYVNGFLYGMVYVREDVITLKTNCNEEVVCRFNDRIKSPVELEFYLQKVCGYIRDSMLYAV